MMDKRHTLHFISRTLPMSLLRDSWRKRKEIGRKTTVKEEWALGP